MVTSIIQEETNTAMACMRAYKTICYIIIIIIIIIVIKMITYYILENILHGKNVFFFLNLRYKMFNFWSLNSFNSAI